MKKISNGWTEQAEEMNHLIDKAADFIGVDPKWGLRSSACIEVAIDHGMTLRRWCAEAWAANAELRAEIRRLTAANKRLRKALKDIVIWAEGSTCEICGKKEMIETDAYDYARTALDRAREKGRG